MKERIKYILMGLAFGAFSIYVFFNMGDWRIVLFHVFEIPYTGILVAVLAALGSVGSFMTAFEKK